MNLNWRQQLENEW